MSEKLYYYAQLKCKPYVRRYLTRHYGCPVKGHPYLVDVRKDKELNAVLHRCIKEPWHHEDKKQNVDGGVKKCDLVEFKLGADLFEREGWSFSYTDVLYLNSLLEGRCKNNLFAFMKIHFLIGESIEYAISQFYREFGFSEETWPSDSIRRCWSRYRKKYDISSMKDEFYGVFTKILMGNMS